jgi:hypothetical protein
MLPGGVSGLENQLKKRLQPALSSFVFRGAWDVKAPFLEFATGDRSSPRITPSDVVPVHQEPASKSGPGLRRTGTA